MLFTILFIDLFVSTTMSDDAINDKTCPEPRLSQVDQIALLQNCIANIEECEKGKEPRSK